MLIEMRHETKQRGRRASHVMRVFCRARTILLVVDLYRKRGFRSSELSLYSKLAPAPRETARPSRRDWSKKAGLQNYESPTVDRQTTHVEEKHDQASTRSAKNKARSVRVRRCRPSFSRLDDNVTALTSTNLRRPLTVPLNIPHTCTHPSPNHKRGRRLAFPRCSPAVLTTLHTLNASRTTTLHLKT